MKDKIVFTKMHGLGNDFVVINTLSQPFSLADFPIKKLANRFTGIGFDQLLLIEPSHEADFRCSIYNSDGSMAEQCGNGMRCIGRFIHEENLSSKENLRIETKAGMIEIHVKDYKNITVNMGEPIFMPPQSIDVQGETYHFTPVSMGNPHVILKVDSLDNYPITETGSLISTHSFFPNGTNVGFMEVVNQSLIRLLTYERGAGETFACGSNACAAVVAGILNHKLENIVKVELPLGDLLIEFHKNKIYMTGPAENVFTGSLTSIR